MAEIRESGSLATRHSRLNRGQIGLRLLFFAIPSAWIFEQVVNYAFASYACFPRGYPRFHVMSAWGWTWAGSIAINALALAACLILIRLSTMQWRASVEHDRSSGNDVMEKGEGPAKYIEMWGWLVGSGFFVVVAFNLIALLLVPMCQK